VRADLGVEVGFTAALMANLGRHGAPVWLCGINGQDSGNGRRP
jgi:hypothetical protein